MKLYSYMTKQKTDTVVLGMIVYFMIVNVSWGRHDCPPGCTNIPELEKVHPFGNSSFIPEECNVGSTCTSITNDFDSLCGGIPNPESYTVDLPNFLSSSYSIDWGQQGPYVVVNGCDVEPFPAVGKVVINGFKSDEYKEVRNTTELIPGTYPPQYTGDGHDFISTRCNKHLFMADYDASVFIVGGVRKDSPLYLGEASQISVTLVNDKCATLQKALNAQVQISEQSVQQVIMHLWRCGPDPSSPSLYKKILSSITNAATVGVKFTNDPFDCKNCPRPGIPPKCPFDSGDGNGGCSSCGGGDGDQETFLAIGNASGKADFNLDGALSMFGSPDVTNPTSSNSTPEINGPGVWLRAAHYPYQAGTVIYYPTIDNNDTPTIEDDDAITKIDYSFDVTVQGYLNYHYEFGLTGPWENEYEDPANPFTLIKSKETAALEAFMAAARGKVRLMYVKDPAYAFNPKGGKILEFSYDGNGNAEKQISYDENGDQNGVICYGYDVNSSLKRIWAGTDDTKYVAPGSGDPDPADGRWVDVSYSGTAGSETLDSVTYGGCSACRAPREYVKGGPNGELTQVKKQGGTVLATYGYDTEGRYTSYTMGQADMDKGVLTVNEWVHSDYDPAHPEETTGDNMMVRRDYVSNTEYRAKVFFADDNGSLVKEIHYHQLQDNPGWLKGPYSVYQYYHQCHDEEGTGNDWKRYVTVYPKGNRLFKYYDYADGQDNGNVIKEKWDGADESRAEYTYYPPGLYSDQTKYLVHTATNEYGGITTYNYTSGMRILSQASPVPGAGVAGSTQDQQVVEYTYDSQGRMWLEKKKDSTGNDVFTKYEYNMVGNLKKQIENYSSSNPSQGLVTTYDYNEYNQLETTTYPSGKVEKKFYSDAGTLIAEAVYGNAATDSAVSATVYIYNDGKLQIKKTAKMNDVFIFSDTEAQNQGGSAITWVSEKYEYDDYGRRKAVISDFGGQNLKTEYQYNNLGEVTRVITPDQRYVKTIRDGRGLVIQEITGVQDGINEDDKATTRIYYDLNGNLIKKVGPMGMTDTTGVTELYQYDLKDQRVRSRQGR